MSLYDQHLDLRRISAAVGLLASIVEGSEDAIIAKSIDGIILSWNPAAERMLGYAEAEAVGSNIEMLIPERHRGEDVVVMERLLSGAKVEHYETQRQHKDGTLVDVSLTVSPLRDGDGKIIGCSKIMRDVTLTNEARRTQERLVAIVESTDDAIIAKDATGRITSWNPAAERIFGYTTDEAIGRHISMLIPEHLAGRERNILGEILAGQKVDHYETTRVAKDGRLVEVSLTVSPLRDVDGTIIGASKVVRDVTERNRIELQRRRATELAQANEQLAAADRLKDQFLAMANHELRTPLTSIQGFTRTLLDLDDRLEPGQKREFLEIIDNQSQRLARLVDDMLTLSRVELGTIDPRPTDTDVLATVRRALREARRDDIDVRGDEDGPLRAFVDPQHLQQMVLNYVDNAAKYGEGPITVSAERRDDQSLLVMVCDSGRGVPAEFETRLFDRFTRSEREIQAGIEGTGLGLSIVRGLARAQGGDAWHEPNEPKGARFCLRLPCPNGASAKAADIPIEA